MSQEISLKEAERKAFRATYNDGLWDVLIGSFVLILAVAPLLSDRLGDFWSSVIFLPFWGLVYLAISLLRKHVVAPRIGAVQFSRARRTKLTRFTLVMVVANILALTLGIAALVFTGMRGGPTLLVLFGLVWLVAFGLAGYLLDISRFYVYGLLLAIAPLVGEWLYNNAGATHHGFPITYGFVAGVMILVGVVLFIRLLVQTSPQAGDGLPGEG